MITHLDTSRRHIQLHGQFTSKGCIGFGIAPKNGFKDLELGACSSFSMFNFIGCVGIECAKIDRCGIHGRDSWRIK